MVGIDDAALAANSASSATLNAQELADRRSRQRTAAPRVISAAAGRFVTRVNTNLLLGFARGPARELHPAAQDNLSTLT